MAKFKAGDVAVDLFTLKPVRVIQQGVLMNGSRTYLVQFLEDDGHEEWVRESNLRHRFEEVASIDDPDAPENDACGFCVALDGGTCADCAGYENVAPEWDDEVTIYSDLIRHLSTPNEPEGDAVNHPSHYTRGKIEVIDFITDQGFNYARGNAVKYISRAGHKNPDTEIEDLEKARFYIDYEIKRLKATDG